MRISRVSDSCHFREKTSSKLLHFLHRLLCGENRFCFYGVGYGRGRDDRGDCENARCVYASHGCDFCFCCVFCDFGGETNCDRVAASYFFWNRDYYQ